jgi:hypothetical protein
MAGVLGLAWGLVMQISPFSLMTQVYLIGFGAVALTIDTPLEYNLPLPAAMLRICVYR